MVGQREVDLRTADLDENGDHCLWHWLPEEHQGSVSLIRGIRAPRVYMPDIEGVMAAPARNVGHGYVFPRPDGYKADHGLNCRICHEDRLLMQRGAPAWKSGPPPPPREPLPETFEGGPGPASRAAVWITHQLRRFFEWLDSGKDRDDPNRPDA